MSAPAVPSGINGDQVLADFQACTGIEDITVALVHLQESEWDLVRAVNRVIPDSSQALPSERTTRSSWRSLNRGLPMEQDLEADLNRMEEDDVLEQFVLANTEMNNGENHTSSSSNASNLPVRNELNHEGPPSGSSASESKISKRDGLTSFNHSSSGQNAAMPPRVTLSSDFLEPGQGTSNSKEGGGGASNREIRFVVHYNGQSFPMSLAQCETIDTLKTLLHAHFEIPPCQQIISGWPTKEPSSNSTRFGSLNLPEEVNLQLTTASSNLSGLNILRNEEAEDRYEIHVHDETNNQDYVIRFEGTKTVRNVKDDFSTLSDIPVRQQAWTGWPAGAVDSRTLNMCGLDKPRHHLFLKKQENMVLPATESTRRQNDLLETTDGSESSDVEDLTESYPIEEDYFVPERNNSSVRHLISDNVINEVVGTIQFSENFSARYGACHPMFYHGGLEDAVKEACQRPAKQRKLLAMYLHHDGSVMSNVFCQQVLCNESVVSYLTNNFVVWGWDVTNETNRQLLITSVNRNFGTPGVSTIRSLDRDKYPVIIVVTRVRSATEITNVLSGSNYATVDELMGTLMHTVEMFQSQQRNDIREEEEREARERVKREQDEAYQASLSADRAKDEAKRMMEQQKRLEEIAKREAAEKEQREREEVAKSLPPEPGSDCTESVCVLKCRLPGSKIVSRRFLHSSILKVLFDFLFSQGFSKEKYKFLTTYPKRDLTTMPDSTVMKEVFSAQDTLIVEER